MMQQKIIAFGDGWEMDSKWEFKIAQPLSLATLASSPARGALYAPFGRQSASLAGEVARRSRDG